MKRSFALALLFAFLPIGVPAAAGTGSIVIRPHPHRTIGVLLFHQVSDDPIESAHGVDRIQEPWTTPAAFDTLLGNLSREGYTVVPLSTALAYFEGRLRASALPEKPLILTFDDGYRTAWTIATPILAKHHDTATMFFEGHATGNPSIPGRLDESDLRAMAASKIWTLESHGWAGHSDLQIDAKGTLSPYWYANLAWLPSQRRLETPQEFERRVENDLARMRSTFQPVLGAKIDVFAYPSGEYGQNEPLPPGANPQTLIEAGHSNASGLTPYLLAALKGAGYRAAFAVSLPESAHFASRSDNIYELPRIGIGARFDPAFLRTIADERGAEYPEVADGQIADAGPICAENGNRYVAATNRPVIFRLDESARLHGTFEFDALRADRPSGRAAISGLLCDGKHLYAVQQAGFDPNPQPYLDEFSVMGDGSLDLVTRRVLPPPMNWLVGIAETRGTRYGIDDRGSIFNVDNGAAAGIIDPGLKERRHDRFAGLAARGGLLYTIDTAEKELVAFAPDGIVVARAPIDPGMRDLAFDGSHLLMSYWTTNVRSMREYDIEELPRQ